MVDIRKKFGDIFSFYNNSLSEKPVNTSSPADNLVIKAAYETYVDVYEEVKEILTYEMTIQFIGNRNKWFGNA